MIYFRMNHGVKSGVQNRNPKGEKRSLSTACHRRHRLCRINMVFRPPKQKSFKGTVAAFLPRRRRGRKRLCCRQWCYASKTKIPSLHTTCWDRTKSNPAVPPGLTQMRPTHPYHHTVALFTECRSVAHRAGTPPSDCPPKSIHTIRSVPRSQLCAALCDIQGSVTCSSSTVSTAL